MRMQNQVAKYADLNKTEEEKFKNEPHSDQRRKETLWVLQMPAMAMARARLG